LLGEDAAAPAVSAEAVLPGVRIAPWLDTEVVSANQFQELHVRFALDDAHLSVEPVPDGFTAVSIALSGDDGLRPQPWEIHGGHQFTVEGLDEGFFVVDGSVEVSVPFMLLSKRDTAGDPDRDVRMKVEIAYQACPSVTCLMPERMTLALPFLKRPNPGYETSDPAAVSPLAHRRIVEQPRGDAELLDFVNAALEGVPISAHELSQVMEDLSSSGFISREGETWLLAG
jgi:hypothetical protein